MKDLPVHYRYEDYITYEGVEIRLNKFYAVRETPCFYFVIDEWAKVLSNPRQRRVSKDSLRRHCYPCKDQALHSYKMRKKSQIRHNELALAKANAALNALNDITEGFDSLTTERPDCWDSIIFD